MFTVNMPKLNLKIIREIKEFCESLPEPPLFFLVLNCKSTRSLYQHRFDAVKMELLAGEKLEQFQKYGRLPKTLVFFIPQLNELVALLRGADLARWDDDKEKWFSDFILPYLCCPIDKGSFTHPVIKLTVGAPENMFRDRYDLRLAHMFERDSFHQNAANPFDTFNPFFPCVAKLPDEWDEMIVKAQMIEVDDLAEELLVHDLPGNVPHQGYAQPVLIPAVAAEHPPVVTPALIQSPVPAVVANDGRLWRYLLIKTFVVEVFSCATCIRFGQGQYNERIGRFAKDFANQKLEFNQKFQSFLTKYPDCSAVLSGGGEKLCEHACFDLFVSGLVIPSGISSSSFSRYARSVDKGQYLLYFACSSIGVLLGILPQLVYFDFASYDHYSRFNQFNSWNASFKNKNFLLIEVGMFGLRSFFDFSMSYIVGDGAARFDIRMPAFACALPVSFRACKGMPKECYMLQDAPYVNSFINQFLLQCGIFFGTLFLPKIVHWLYDDAPKVTRQIMNTTRNLLGGASRFFYRLFSRDEPHTPIVEQHTDLTAH